MKLVSPEEQRASRPEPVPVTRRRPQSTAGKYVILDCGHYSDERTQEAYSAWHNTPGMFLCEVCGIEVAGRTSHRLPPQPDEPPF